MCTTCGCTLTSGTTPAIESDTNGQTTVAVLHGLLSANDHQAAHNREHVDQHGVLAINLMSSPGAGKTSLLEATIEALSATWRIAVIEGDLETENDAERIRAKGVPAIQITTGTACHLDAHLIHQALHQLDLDAIDLLLIENVGNLVCPASFDLGQHRNVILLSVPEGDDKPAKYPVMFRAADLVLCAKADLLPVMPEFDPERAEQHLRALASSAPFMRVSVRTPPALQPWFDWLDTTLQIQRARLASGHTTRPTLETPTHRVPERDHAASGHHHHHHHHDHQHAESTPAHD
ncbi:hydrogenase nickel incorporation protein HypB [Allochromatium warmingii]|uniref:Hydrogenase maturation factor HypB n=1 Tax=Allochromatium warmingii TaxID=61595 RepID=A0A1H3GUV5_ALLWA|nr:hydrogenase nickel incorporation protein HypB [Allochromatium warmingii]SDY06765.1 hydrogenase nickel incorporation protein HypB [Allochromatium warmingii]